MIRTNAEDICDLSEKFMEQHNMENAALKYAKF